MLSFNLLRSARVRSWSPGSAMECRRELSTTHISHDMALKLTYQPSSSTGVHSTLAGHGGIVTTVKLLKDEDGQGSGAAFISGDALGNVRVWRQGRDGRVSLGICDFGSSSSLSSELADRVRGLIRRSPTIFNISPGGMPARPSRESRLDWRFGWSGEAVESLGKRSEAGPDDRSEGQITSRYGSCATTRIDR